MSLADANIVKAEGNIPDVPDSALEPFIMTASIEVKRLLTKEKYNLIKTYENSSDEDEQEMFVVCRKAEANLTLSYAIHTLNIETQGHGLVSATGYDQSRNELLSRHEINGLSEHFRELALTLLGPYLPVAKDDPLDDSDDMISAGDYSFSAL